MINTKTLDELHAAIKIEEVLGRELSITKKGHRLWACCPFHHEKTPSFSISPERGVYKCFGCGESGDAITFLQKKNNISFYDAVKILADYYNIKVEESIIAESVADKEHEEVLLVLAKINDFYRENLRTEEGKTRALRYAKERNLSETAIDQFNIGYSPLDSSLLYNFLKSQELSETAIVNSGVFLERNGNFYDRFRGRLIFPISNIYGKITSFGARIIEADNAQAKYINSPESIVFQKRNSIYGIYNAKGSIKKLNSCYLVEGYTDVIAFFDKEIRNVIASMGTALTSEQIKIISRYCENIIIIFDGDNAGIRAAIKNIDLILENGLYVKIVALPQTEDPHSLACKMHSEELKMFLKNNEVDFVEFKAKILANDLKKDASQTALSIREIIKSISFIRDDITKSILTKRCSEIFGVSESILFNEQDRVVAKGKKIDLNLKVVKTNKPVEQVSERELIAQKMEATEREIIKMLISNASHINNNREVLNKICTLIGNYEFSNFCFRTIWEELKNSITTDQLINIKTILQHRDDNIKKMSISLMLDKYEISDSWKKATNSEAHINSSNFSTNILEQMCLLKMYTVQIRIIDNLTAWKFASTDEEINKFFFAHDRLLSIELELKKKISELAIERNVTDLKIRK